jgi:hypothetical protein
MMVTAERVSSRLFFNFFFSYLTKWWASLPSFNGLDIVYAGLVKILKKYEKRSGSLIRLPFIQKVLQQPFYTTDVLNKLVKECEGMLDHLFSKNDPSSPPEATNKEEGSGSKVATEGKQTQLKVPKELAEIKHMESMYMKLTESALCVLKKVRSGSSTVSVFSLPPMQNNSMEWKSIPLVEQAAK